MDQMEKLHIFHFWENDHVSNFTVCPSELFLDPPPSPFLSILYMISSKLILFIFHYFRVRRLRSFWTKRREDRLGGRAPRLGQARGPGAAASWPIMYKIDTRGAERGSKYSSLGNYLFSNMSKLSVSNGGKRRRGGGDDPRPPPNTFLNF